MDNIFLDILLNFLRRYFFVFIIIFLVILFIIIRKLFKTKSQGDIGEQEVRKILKKLPRKKYFTINDIMIKSHSGTSQIDHMVFSRYGIFVIETKNHIGLIYGDEDYKVWVKNINGRMMKFESPVYQNMGHIKRLKQLDYRFNDKNLISIVAFSKRGKLKNKINNVVYYSGLKKLIKSYKKKILTEEEVREYYDFLSKKNITNKKKRKAHVKNIKLNYS